jgi:hypothetical protein
MKNELMDILAMTNHIYREILAFYLQSFSLEHFYVPLQRGKFISPSEI